MVSGFKIPRAEGTYNVETCKPHEASLLFVASLSALATHMLKACLGTASLNHITPAQSFSSCRYLTDCQEKNSTFSYYACQ